MTETVSNISENVLLKDDVWCINPILHMYRIKQRTKCKNQSTQILMQRMVGQRTLISMTIWLNAIKYKTNTITKTKANAITNINTYANADARNARSNTIISRGQYGWVWTKLRMQIQRPTQINTQIPLQRLLGQRPSISRDRSDRVGITGRLVSPPQTLPSVAKQVVKSAQN